MKNILKNLQSPIKIQTYSKVVHENSFAIVDKFYLSLYVSTYKIYTHIQ